MKRSSFNDATNLKLELDENPWGVRAPSLFHTWIKIFNLKVTSSDNSLATSSPTAEIPMLSAITLIDSVGKDGATWQSSAMFPESVCLR